ncbi:MAG: hypothetical protein DI628_00270 [Blastochloris viridis]|uniref:Uncharacterized protein n=1 Tax=Blastochloris viridis TaxID=1079 RepID=A0A6N4R6Q1_BLAVI|nr:MAG: hypothetical protein DI628_00270 [Blastochloris viridis]
MLDLRYFELSTFHRRVLWVAAGVIGTFQTISIFTDPERHLNGIDWILAYVVVAGLVIAATYKPKGITSGAHDVQSVLQAVKSEGVKIPENAAYASIGREVVEDVLAYVVKNKSEVLGTLQQPNMSLERMAVCMMYGAASHWLASGRYHTYRGILNSQGKFLHEFANHLLDRRVALQEMNQAQRVAEMQSLRAAIKEVG